MKCRHCGNNILGEAKYCSSCGNPVNGKVDPSFNRTVVANPIEEMAKEKKSGSRLYYDNSSSNYRRNGYVGSNATSKSSVGCLIVFLMIFFSVFFGAFGFIFSAFDSFGSKEFIEFAEDSIPTLYELNGESNACSYSTIRNDNEEEVVMEYCDDSDYGELFEDYKKYLIATEDFEIISSDDVIKLGKLSDEEGYMLIVELDYINETITYTKVYDNLED